MLNATPGLQAALVATRAGRPIVTSMAKSNDIKESFSALLRNSLRARYGRIPSAAVVAREFNLRAYDTSPISQESARRWLRGVSLPEEERLRVLVNWLNLDFNEALKPRSHMPFHTASMYSPNSSGADAVVTRSRDGKTINSVPTTSNNPASDGHHVGNGLAGEEAELITLMMQLDAAQRAALRDLLKLSLTKVAHS
jgi:hypothetical protein